MSWNWLDLVILLIIVVNAFNGAKRGLVRTLFGLAGLFIAFFICYKGTPFVASLLQELSISGTVAYLISLGVLFGIIYYLINDIGRHFHSLIKESDFHRIDLAGGVIFGGVKGIVYTFFLLIPFLGNIFASPVLLTHFEGSFLLQQAKPVVYFAEPYFQGLIYQGKSSWESYHKGLEQIAEPINTTNQKVEDIITNF